MSQGGVVGRTLDKRYRELLQRFGVVLGLPVWLWAAKVLWGPTLCNNWFRSWCSFPCSGIYYQKSVGDCQIRPWGSLYTIAAPPEPTSPCHTIPCIPSPRGSLTHLLHHIWIISPLGIPCATGTLPYRPLSGLGNLRPLVPDPQIW